MPCAGPASPGAAQHAQCAPLLHTQGARARLISSVTCGARAPAAAAQVQESAEEEAARLEAFARQLEAEAGAAGASAAGAGPQ